MKTESFELSFPKPGVAIIFYGKGRTEVAHSLHGVFLAIGDLVEHDKITITKEELEEVVENLEEQKTQKLLPLFTKGNAGHEFVYMKNKFLDIMTLHWFKDEVEAKDLPAIHLLELLQKE